MLLEAATAALFTPSAIFTLISTILNNSVLATLFG